VSHREFSCIRQEKRLRGTMVRGHRPGAAMLAKRPCCQHGNRLPSIPASSRNACRAPSPGRTQSAWCPIGTPAAPGHSRHHDYALALRHRRIPREHEVAAPEEVNTPEEEDAPEEEETSGPEDDEHLSALLTAGYVRVDKDARTRRRSCPLTRRPGTPEFAASRPPVPRPPPLWSYRRVPCAIEVAHMCGNTVHQGAGVDGMNDWHQALRSVH
jgi:hypothetical protein